MYEKPNHVQSEGFIMNNNFFFFFEFLVLLLGLSFLSNTYLSIQELYILFQLPTKVYFINLSDLAELVLEPRATLRISCHVRSTYFRLNLISNQRMNDLTQNVKSDCHFVVVVLPCFRLLGGGRLASTIKIRYMNM